jgi:hypothetical protein
MANELTAKELRERVFWRVLAEADPELGWAELDDLPMEQFWKILAERERTHPEKITQEMRDAAAAFSEEDYENLCRISGVKRSEGR